MTGLVAGLVMGDVPKAMIVTAALQMIYMGVFSPGGSMPAEPSIAAAIAVPVARRFEAGSGYCRSGSCRSFRKLFISIPFLY